MKFLRKAGSNYVSRFLQHAGRPANNPSGAEDVEVTPEQQAALNVLLGQLIGVVDEVTADDTVTVATGEEPIYTDSDNNLVLGVHRAGGFALGRDRVVGALPTRLDNIGGTGIYSLDEVAVTETYGMSSEDLLTRLNAATVARLQTATVMDDPEAVTSAPEAIVAALDKDAINTALAGADPAIDERVHQVEYNAMASTYVVFTVGGGSILIPGADVTDAAGLTRAIYSEMGLDAAEIAAAINPNAAAIAAFKGTHGLSGTINNSKTPGNGLRSVPFAARKAFIAGLPAAVQAQITGGAPYKGTGIQNSNLVVFLNATPAASTAGAPATAPNAAPNVVPNAPSRLIELDSYVAVIDNISGAQTVASIEAAIKAEPEAKEFTYDIQQDLKTLGLYTSSIDGLWGPGTRGALTKALTAHTTLADIHRVAQEKEFQAEAGTISPDAQAIYDEIAAGRTPTAAMLDKLVGSGRTKEMQDLVALAEANPTHAAAIGVAIEQGLQRAKMTGTELEKARETLGDASGRFMSGLRRAGEITKAARSMVSSRGSREQLAKDMEASNVGFALNENDPGLAAKIKALGIESDQIPFMEAIIITGHDTAKDAKTGVNQTGALRVPLSSEAGKALVITNVVFKNGAIFAQMENGCDGNLVIIPIEGEKYVPAPQPKRPRNQVTTGEYPRGPVVPDYEPPVEEPDPDYHTREECHNGDWSLRQWRGNWGAVTWTVINANDPRCDHGDGDDGDGPGGDGKGGGDAPGGPT